MQFIDNFSTDVPSPVILADKSRVKINSNKITLKWTEPENNGAAIFAYKVYKRTVNEDGEKFEWDFVSQTSAPRSVITLERGETFDLIVTAKNKSGESFKREDNAKRVEVLEGEVELFPPSIIHCDVDHSHGFCSFK